MKILYLLLILSSIAISSCQSMMPVSQFPIDPTLTPSSPPKQISNTTLPLVERWRRPGTVFGSEHPSRVVVAEEHVIIVGYDGRESKIMVFDVHSGDFFWESEYLITTLATLHVLDNRIYVGTGLYALAFDLQTGEELWQGAKQPRNKKGFLYVYPTKEQIHVYDFSQNYLYILDPQTGMTLEEIEYPYIFLKQGDIYYSGCGYAYMTSCLHQKNPKDYRVHWSQEFKGPTYNKELIFIWPIFTEDRIILNAGGHLYTLDSTTGNIIWQSEDWFITGPTVQDDLVYAVRFDAAIIAFDLETGAEIGKVTLTPEKTNEDDGRYVLHYAIDASDNFVAVYYGNSQELIVFEKVENTDN